MANSAAQLEAGGNIYPSRFVKLDASNDFTALQATANDELLGVSQEGTNYPPLSDQSVSSYAAEAGEPVQLFAEGDICLVEAGDTVVRGNLLKADANGKAVPIASTGTTVQRYGAIALQSGASGNLILVQVRFGSERPALT